MQIARHYWLASGSRKHKVSRSRGYHADDGTFRSAGYRTWSSLHRATRPGFTRSHRYPYRDRGTGTDEELVTRRRGSYARNRRRGPDTVSA